MAVQVGRSEEGWVGVADPCSSATLSYLLGSTAGIAGCWQQHGASPAGHRAEQTGRSGLRGCSESVVRAAGQNSSAPPTLPFLRRKDPGYPKLHHKLALGPPRDACSCMSALSRVIPLSGNKKGYNSMPDLSKTKPLTTRVRGFCCMMFDLPIPWLTE